jgi:hypothetical protein
VRNPSAQPGQASETTTNHTTRQDTTAISRALRNTYVPAGESVQAATNQAQAEDEIWIEGGVYTENRSITQSIALRGSWNVGFTVQGSTTTLTSAISGEG